MRVPQRKIGMMEERERERERKRYEWERDSVGER